VAQNTQTNYKPALKYEKYDKISSSNVGRRIIQESPFGRAGVQTLSTACRGRLILKNSFGMPKESVKVF